MKTIESIRNTIQNRKTRSAWDKGVKLYALELLDNIDDPDALANESCCTAHCSTARRTGSSTAKAVVLFAAIRTLQKGSALLPSSAARKTETATRTAAKAGWTYRHAPCIRQPKASAPHGGNNPAASRQGQNPAGKP